jgi:diaminohydroxyphosphoribosylaminopyrimidine deaminase / 5-amino-6-(5-phosphoribosylamino)uracil reductase
MSIHVPYMHRCIELAKLGSSNVAPNPMVGAVLVHNNFIIGEGYHKQYGGAHAEVNCLQSVSENSKHLIPASTLYVSLEPCAHFGKTPPCADLIISMQIKKVVVGCRDPFDAVNGKGIEKLLAAGIEVTTGILENECRRLNKRFFTMHTLHRPYIILKWAQSKDGKINSNSGGRTFISNLYSNRLVHKWRSQQMAVMAGTNTVLIDDPLLTVRLWPGKQPLRVLLDKNLKVPFTNKIFNNDAATLVFNEIINDEHLKEKLSNKQNAFYQLNKNENTLMQICNALYQAGIHSVLIEGGSKLLQSFINAGLWDEARIITNNNLVIGSGINAPLLLNPQLLKIQVLQNDSIHYYKAPNNQFVS